MIRSAVFSSRIERPESAVTAIFGPVSGAGVGPIITLFSTNRSYVLANNQILEDGGIFSRLEDGRHRVFQCMEKEKPGDPRVGSACSVIARRATAEAIAKVLLAPSKKMPTESGNNHRRKKSQKAQSSLWRLGPAKAGQRSGKFSSDIGK